MGVVRYYMKSLPDISNLVRKEETCHDQKTSDHGIYFKHPINAHYYYYIMKGLCSFLTLMEKCKHGSQCCQYQDHILNNKGGWIGSEITRFFAFSFKQYMKRVKLYDK